MLTVERSYGLVGVIKGAKIAHIIINERRKVDNRAVQFICLSSFWSELTLSNENILENLITFLRPGALLDPVQHTRYQLLNLK